MTVDPTGVSKQLSATLRESLCRQARTSPRGRASFAFHDTSDDPVQRFLNALQPGTYVRPHRHDDPEKWEMTIALSGRAVVLILDSDSMVRERFELDATGPLRGVEIPAGVWHTCAALEPDTVLLEIKRGPYVASSDKDFAAWAPAEGATSCAAFERRLRRAIPGDRLNAFTGPDSSAAEPRQ